MLRAKVSVGRFRCAALDYPGRPVGLTSKRSKLVCAAALLMALSGGGLAVPTALGHDQARGEGNPALSAQAHQQGHVVDPGEAKGPHGGPSAQPNGPPGPDNGPGHGKDQGQGNSGG